MKFPTAASNVNYHAHLEHNKRYQVIVILVSLDNIEVKDNLYNWCQRMNQYNGVEVYNIRTCVYYENVLT